MKNFIDTGDLVVVSNPDHTDAAVIASGDGFLVGSLFGVAVTDIAVDGEGPLKTTGTFDLPKVSAQAWTVGQRIYWVAASGECTTTAGSNKLIGVATAVADNPSATGRVRLTAAFTI